MLPEMFHDCYERGKVFRGVHFIFVYLESLLFSAVNWFQCAPMGQILVCRVTSGVVRLKRDSKH